MADHDRGALLPGSDRAGEPAGQIRVLGRRRMVSQPSASSPTGMIGASTWMAGMPTRSGTEYARGARPGAAASP
ncbi:hypothetical protein SALBM311S_02177 [Streptomyces alboniger]